MLLDGTYPPDARVRKEVKALRESGHTVRIVCPGTSSERSQVDGAAVRRFRPASPSSLRGAGEIYQFLQGMYPDWQREIQRECEAGVDVFHVHDLALARTAFETVSDRPIVLDLHENYPAAVRQYRKTESLGEMLTNPEKLARRVVRSQSHWNRRLEHGLRDADHVLAVVPEARDVYLDDTSVEATVTVVSNTVDLEWFDRMRAAHQEPSTDGFVLTYAGTLSGEHRGIETAIHALERLRQTVPDATLRLVGGRSTHKSRLETLVDRRGLDDAVEFTGWVDEATIPSQIAAADVGLVPHQSSEHTETTVPHKLFQYMAAGIPVVVTETGPVARIVRESEAGIPVPPDDPAEMAAAVRTLTSADVRERLGRNARSAVESKYNWNRDGARLQDVYNKFESAAIR